jgi:Tfp pilus assembly protein PilX
VVWVLMIIAVIALLGAGALHDTWFAQSQAGTRLYEQRAWALAELGLRAAAADLAARVPDESLHNLNPTANPTEHLTTRVRKLSERGLSAGFSAGRIIAQDFEIESTGYSVRGVRRSVVQGMHREIPAMETP